MSKLIHSIANAIQECGLKDGMCISFHHHLRSGDYVLNMVMDEIAKLGIRNITVNASSLHDGHSPLIKHIQNGVVTGLETNYIGPAVGKSISNGDLAAPVVFRTHGGRAADITSGRSKIDIAFIAASASDNMGNCTGKIGKSACGSLGYAFEDMVYANKKVIITDYLVPYPLTCRSLSETYADYVVVVDSIGNPSGIVSGTTRMPKDPIALRIADLAAKAIDASGLLKDGMSFQTGAGGASLAVAKYLKQIMKERSITGSYALGGITGYIVDMLREGYIKAICDVQCFDLKAIESLADDPAHYEISACEYASPDARSSVSSNLDIVVLGASEIDTDFNINVHIDSNGYIIGGSGGHSDVAEDAKLTVIVAPLSRARLSTIVDKVGCISTAGSNIDMLVTQAGIAVNPRREELTRLLKAARLPVYDIRGLKKNSEDLNGIARKPEFTKNVVAKVYSRYFELLDHIYQVV